MSKMLDYIAKRRAEIKAQTASLKDELRELDVAEQALTARNAEKSQASADGKKTIKEMVAEILGNEPGGATASQIIEHMKLLFGANIERSSLSPQLSRLKADNTISLDGSLWKLNPNSPEGIKSVFQ